MPLKKWFWEEENFPPQASLELKTHVFLRCKDRDLPIDRFRIKSFPVAINQKNKGKSETQKIVASGNYWIKAVCFLKAPYQELLIWIPELNSFASYKAKSMILFSGISWDEIKLQTGQMFHEWQKAGKNWVDVKELEHQLIQHQLEMENYFQYLPEIYELMPELSSLKHNKEAHIEEILQEKIPLFEKFRFEEHESFVPPSDIYERYNGQKIQTPLSGYPQSIGFSLMNLAKICLKTGKRNYFEQEFDEAILWLNYFHTFFKLLKSVSWQSEFKKEINQYYKFNGLSHFSIRNYEETKHLLKSYLNFDPACPQSNYILATACYKTGNMVKAKKYFERAFYFGYHINDLYVNLSICYALEDKNYHKAILLTLQIIEVLPNDPQLCFNLSCFYALNEEETKALEYADKANTLNFNLKNEFVIDAFLVRLKDKPLLHYLFERYRSFADLRTKSADHKDKADDSRYLTIHSVPN